MISAGWSVDVKKGQYVAVEILRADNTGKSGQSTGATAVQPIYEYVR